MRDLVEVALIFKKDLNFLNEMEPLENLNLSAIKFKYISTVNVSSLVILLDEKRAKVIKNRWGKPGKIGKLRDLLIEHNALEVVE